MSVYYKLSKRDEALGVACTNGVRGTKWLPKSSPLSQELHSWVEGFTFWNVIWLLSRWICGKTTVKSLRSIVIRSGKLKFVGCRFTFAHHPKYYTHWCVISVKLKLSNSSLWCSVKLKDWEWNYLCQLRKSSQAKQNNKNAQKPTPKQKESLPPSKHLLSHGSPFARWAFIRGKAQRRKEYYMNRVRISDLTDLWKYSA